MLSVSDLEFPILYKTLEDLIAHDMFALLEAIQRSLSPHHTKFE